MTHVWLRIKLLPTWNLYTIFWLMIKAFNKVNASIVMTVMTKIRSNERYSIEFSLSVNNCSCQACPGYDLSWIRVVPCTSWVRVVLGTSWPGYELSWIWVVLGASRLGYELSWVRVVQIPTSWLFTLQTRRYKSVHWCMTLRHISTINKIWTPVLLSDI